MVQINGSRHTARELRISIEQGFKPAGDCLRPIPIRYRGAPDKVLAGLGLEKDQIAVANFDARCRKCDMCLAHRRRLWTARAIDECKVGVRNWFGTLTFKPFERTRVLYRAQLGAARASVDWAELDTAEQYARTVDVANRDVTLWLKRVRKESGARFRYLLVSEAHSDGFPHFHVILHEHVGTVLKRHLDGGWRVGFSQFRLMPVGDEKAAFYACKYLSKSALTRVRASQRYGQANHIVRLVAERLEAVNRTVSEASPVVSPPVPKA